jgi:hypothetical protein
MEITITIAGEELNSKLAAKQLRMIADMVKGGSVAGSGFNIEYLGEFSFEVDFESDGTHPHTDYWDGEHNHIHVDDEGIVISRRGPDKEDGTGDLENLHDKGITVAEWAKAHGGITPWTEEEH